MSPGTIPRSDVSNASPTQRNVVQFWIYMTMVAVGAVSICIGFRWGWVLGVVLMLTVVGILLPGLMIITTLKKQTAQWLNLLGIVMAAAGYALGLYGYFHPVDQLTLKTAQTFDVRSAPGSCLYDPQKSHLTCDVSVAPH